MSKKRCNDLGGGYIMLLKHQWGHSISNFVIKNQNQKYIPRVDITVVDLLRSGISSACFVTISGYTSDAFSS